MCLPRRAVCDRLVNCPGKSYEDEVHCAHTPAQTCGDLLLMGYPTGAYDVRPLNLGMGTSAPSHVHETGLQYRTFPT